MGLTIATGFVVDDAIVVIENITRHIEGGMPAMRAALKGVAKVVATREGFALKLSGMRAAAVLARPIEEQAVELGRKPHCRDMQAERRLALRRPAVDSHDPAQQATVAPGRLQSGADREPAVRRIDRGGDRPGRGVRLLAARAPADFIETGPAQPATRRQEGQRLQEIGLARAVGADQHDGLGAAIEAELAIVAEIGQAKLAHGKDGRRSAGCGVGREGKSADRRRRHTRIGMST